MPRTEAGTRHQVRDFVTCLNFDGVDDFIATATDLSFSGVFTFTCWFRRTDANPNWIIGHTAGNQKIGIFGGTANTSVLVRLSNGGSTSTINVGYTTGMDNQWHFVAVRRDASNVMSASLDGGTFVTGATLSGTALYNRIGKDNATDYYKGFLDGLRFYASSLTQAQITGLYYGTEPVDAKVLWYKFDEGSGTAAVDSSGTQADGTITGATYSTDVRFKPRTASTGRFPKTPQIQDPFTRADSALTLGTTTVGGLAWSAVTGVMGISSNTAYYVSGGDDTFWTVDAGTPNITASVTMSTYGSGAKEQGIYFRVVDANNWWRMLRSNSSLLLQRRVASSITTMGTTTPAMADGDVYKIRAYNNNIQMLLNDRLVYSVDDTSLNTATKHGIGVGTANTGSRWDNFSIAKLI